LDSVLCSKTKSKKIKDFVPKRARNSACWHRWLNIAMIVGIFTFSFLLRLYRLGAHDFWYDEVYSAHYATYPWDNWNAPLYWIVLHFWVKIFGFSEFSLRTPSMLFSFLTTGIVFLLGKELFNRKTAILATLLIVLSPFHLWYAQEARDYSMVVFWGTLSSYILFLTVKENRFKKWLAFTFVSLAGMYTNYFYVFLVVAQFLYLLCIFRFRIRKIYTSFLLIAGIFGFYIPRFMSKFSFVSKGFWVSPPEWRSLGITLQNYMLGYSGTTFLYALSFFLTLAIFVVLFWVACREKEARRNIVFCIFLFVIPISSVFLFSKLFFSVYLTRGLLLFSPYFYLLIACAVMKLRKKVATVTSCILVGIVGCGSCLYFKEHLYPPLEYHLGAYLKKPVKPIVDFLSRNVGEKDLVALTNISVFEGINFYAKNKFLLYYLFVPQILDTSGRRPVEESPQIIPVHKITAHKFEKIWVISTDWGRTGMPDENSVVVKQWLESHLRLLSSVELDGLWIYCYEKKDSG